MNISTLIDFVIIVAYFSVPVALLLFLQRFRTKILDELRLELTWFVVLTAGGGMDHVLTAIGVLPHNMLLKALLAIILGTAAVAMVATKVRMAHNFQQYETTATLLRGEAANAKENAVKAGLSQHQFMSVLLHEMRNPMQTIISMTDVLVNTATRAQQSAVGSIINSVNLMRRIADDVIDLAKLEAGELTINLTPFDLHQLMKGITTEFDITAAAKKISFHHLIATDVPTRIISDPIRLHQILLHLLSNAFKFTDKGKVTVAVRRQRSKNKASQLIIEVNDTGRGISSVDLDRIWVPYSQAKLATYRALGGAGLGLSITKQLVAAMGGSIQVESKELKGSRFTARIPLTETKESRVAPSTSPRNLQSNRKQHVLLVDDNIVISKLIGRMLTNSGFLVTSAFNGQQAVDAVSKNLSKFLFIFMDLTMPVMDGYTASSQLRSKGYNGPIIAMTAKAMEGERETVKSFGMVDIIWKPVAKRDLLAVIARNCT